MAFVRGMCVAPRSMSMKWLQNGLVCREKYINLQILSRFFSSQNDDQMVSKRRFSLTFEEYQKLRRKIRTQKRISGIPFAAVGLTTSSMVSVMLNPNLFEATDPEQIQPIL